MTYRVTLEDTKTGRRVTVDQDGTWSEGAEFWWTEGNMGCDCNRGPEFIRAGGEPPDLALNADGYPACNLDGDGSRFRLVSVEEAGRVVFEEESR